ncbi:Alpha/Beta hydrolase protein [Aspergillus desertorum]
MPSKYPTCSVGLAHGPESGRTIRGLQFDAKARRYAGVPYALPPTKQHRWRKPRPLPESYTYAGEVPGPAFDATKSGPVCSQKAYHRLFVNIWTPAPDPLGQEKEKKWPVMLWMHGGWFQMGDPSQEAGMDPTELFSTGKLNAIVVAIGYRLNVFGFLAGPDVLADSESDENRRSGGNYGLWDQRLAADPRLYRRFFMDSNAIPAQPKSLSDTEEQFDELCAYFNIDLQASSAEKLSQLRQKTPQELVAAIPNLKNHTFRLVSDDLFIHHGMAEYLASKEFASAFKARKARLLIGEVLNEETLYSTYNSPTEPTIEAQRAQIGNYYAPDVAERALRCYALPKSTDLSEWKKLFGQIISDGQVRAPSRVLVSDLVCNGVDLADIWRYQIAYRLSFIDEKVAPMSLGVAHAMDKPFWNFSICYGPTPPERRLMEEWIKNLVAFVNDDASFEFGTRTVQEMKVVSPEGVIEIENDERWEELLRIGEILAQ